MRIIEKLEEVLKPPTPKEPPPGTVLWGKCAEIWVRPSTLPLWARTGDAVSYSWERAHELGADPNKPLYTKGLTPKLVLNEVLSTLGDYSGFDYWWFNLDGDRQEEILTKLKETLGINDD